MGPFVGFWVFFMTTGIFVGFSVTESLMEVSSLKDKLLYRQLKTSITEKGTAVSTTTKDADTSPTGTTKTVTSSPSSGTTGKNDTSAVKTATNTTLHGINMTTTIGTNTSTDVNETYPCTCSDNQTVSLLGRADYCLSPTADIAQMCGNADVKDNGLCPTKGAMPCQKKQGHVLIKDAICLLNNKVYKCVADKEDIEYSKKYDKGGSNSSTETSDGSTSNEPTETKGKGQVTYPLSMGFLLTLTIMMTGGMIFT